VLPISKPNRRKATPIIDKRIKMKAKTSITDPKTWRPNSCFNLCSFKKLDECPIKESQTK
jgi:hypothetical protein